MSKLTNAIASVFAHKHEFKQAGYVTHPSDVNPLSAAPVTAVVFRCRCGAERREMTDAGFQQISWGDERTKVMGL